MYTKFAAALIAPIVAAGGLYDGTSRENAMEWQISSFPDSTVDVHLYNARVANEDGTFTYEFHGDFGIDATQISRRFMYGFCIRPKILQDDGSNTEDWDCMTVKVDLRDVANATVRYVQDGWAPSADFTQLSPNFKAAWLTENADWQELAAKSSLCDESPLPAGDPIDCTGFNTHFKRNFSTGEADKDHQLSTDQAGVDWEMAVFVQEYDPSVAMWDD